MQENRSPTRHHGLVGFESVRRPRCRGTADRATREQVSAVVVQDPQGSLIRRCRARKPWGLLQRIGRGNRERREQSSILTRKGRTQLETEAASLPRIDEHRGSSSNCLREVRTDRVVAPGRRRTKMEDECEEAECYPSVKTLPGLSV